MLRSDEPEVLSSNGRSILKTANMQLPITTQFLFQKGLTYFKTYNIINFAVNETANVRLAQLDRASGYGPEGREFESSIARTKRDVAYAASFLL